MLADLGTWGAADVLHGRVGVVTTPEAREGTERAVEGWHLLGIDVVAVASPDGSAASGVAAARDFASSGVQVVVLAAPVDVQRRFTAAATVLLGGARYVVADGFDAVWDEGYLPTFDGAVARTAAWGPWHERAEGVTPVQARCRAVWEAAATPPLVLPGELQRVYGWCAATELAGRAAAAGVEAMTAELYDSPATSPLVPSATGFGPTASSVLVWHAACACWTER